MTTKRTIERWTGVVAEWKAKLAERTVASLLEERASLYITQREADEEYRYSKSMLARLERRDPADPECERWREMVEGYERERLPYVRAQLSEIVPLIDSVLREKGVSAERLKAQSTKAHSYDLMLWQRTVFHPDNPVPEFLLR